jgi:hypothetical protein
MVIRKDQALNIVLRALLDEIGGRDMAARGMLSRMAVNLQEHFLPHLFCAQACASGKENFIRVLNWHRRP